jgi:hypothetical protein
MSFDFEFDEFETESTGLDGYFDGQDDPSLQRLASDSQRRAQHRMEGREITPQGERSSERRIQGQDNNMPDRVKVSSIRDLEQFVRLSDGVFMRRDASNDLVRESEQDLWRLNEDDEGDLVIERMYDDNGDPIQG